MKVHFSIDNLPMFNRSVVTIGTFDGVHGGHRKIFDLMKQEATAIGGETVIITFDPHPRQIIAPSSNRILLLNTLDEKIELIAQQGIDHLVVVPFTKDLAAISASDFIKEFLVKYFQPHTIIIGYDHRFGNKREGNYKLLEDAAPLHGYIVKEIPVFMLQDSAISSTRIRTAINEGDMGTATKLLSYTYFFGGTVVKGNQLGRTIGFPTANIQLNHPDKLIPANGVYAVTVSFASHKYADKYGMMNIGMKPTVIGKALTIEVNIFDFDEDIYDKNISVAVHHYLRPEQKFDGIEMLKAQLHQDKITVEKYFNITTG